MIKSDGAHCITAPLLRLQSFCEEVFHMEVSVDAKMLVTESTLNAECIGIGHHKWARYQEHQGDLRQ